MRSRNPWRLAGNALLASLCLMLGCLSLAAPTGEATVEQRIRYYSKRIQEDPGHYPSHAALGRAWLDSARQSLDPEAVRQARAALQKSNQLQVNFEALKASAELENLAHRFDEALDWARRAAEALPEDRQLLALQIEARVGQGQLSEAKALLGRLDDPPVDFYAAAARGVYFEAAGDISNALMAYDAAAERARLAGVSRLRVWALVKSAGVLIDRGARLEEARSRLETAKTILPHDRLLRLHLAELARSSGEFAEALEICRALLAEEESPGLHALSADLNRRLERVEEAARHFTAAEAAYLRAVEAGEGYTLTALAELYCQSGQLDLARQFLEKARSSGQGDRHLQDVANCLEGT